ncbi:MAG: hypothetical protein ABSA83_17060 [Verrucomicrobiota bacterium]
MSSANESSAFVLLAWNEMFAPDTPDSFQPKLMNIPALVEELQLIAERASRSSKWEKHVRKIQDELKASCKAEQNLLDASPRLRWGLQTLSEKTNLLDLLSLAKTLEQPLLSHEDMVKQALAEATAGLPDSKIAAFACLRRLATIALRKKRTAEDFSALMIPANFNRTPGEIIQAITEAIDAPAKEFNCILAVKGQPNELQAVARKVGFQLRSHREIPVDGPGTQFLQATKDAVLLSINLEAGKALDAAILAVRRLRPVLDIFNFYRHDALTFFDEVLVIGANSQPVLVKPQLQWAWQTRKKKTATYLTKSLIASASEERLTGQVFNALEHYSLAQTSTVARVRLANLWSALECLAGGDTAESVIGSICQVVAPIVAWRRTGKILSYTAKNLDQFGSVAGGPLGSGFPPGEGGVPSDRLLLALARPKGHPDAEQLQVFASAHPLLRFRIFSLWKILSAPADFAKELKASANRTEWHLHRIYRARNLSVHEGREVTHSSQLLENLHYYFSVTLSRILHGMKLNPAWQVSDSIAHWRMQYDYTVSSLETRPGILSVSDLLPKPRPTLSRSTIWAP